MITIYTLEEINELRNISEGMKEELLSYFEEIAKGIVGEDLVLCQEKVQIKMRNSRSIMHNKLAS